METGIISQSAEQYHAAAGVSRSMLNVLFEKTPLHYKSRFILKESEEKETPALRLGRLTHRCVLEPDTMSGAFHVQPETITMEISRLKALKSAKVVSNENAETTGKCEVEWSGVFAEAKAWEAEHQDRPILTREEATAMVCMRDAVWRHPLASRMLKNADFERSAFANDDGLLLKSRYDAMPRSGNCIPDLKTCEDAGLDNVEKRINADLLWRQAAFYLRVADLLYLPFEIFAFIFVEKTPPYAVAVYQLDEAVLNAGFMTISRDIQLLRNCIEKDEWPGYSPELNIAALPQWMMRRLESEL